MPWMKDEVISLYDRRRELKQHEHKSKVRLRNTVLRGEQASRKEKKNRPRRIGEANDAQ